MVIYRVAYTKCDISDRFGDDYITDCVPLDFESTTEDYGTTKQ